MAIGVILGIVFAVLLIGAVALASVMFWKNGSEGGSCIGYISTGIVSAFLAVGFFFCFLFIPFSYHQVDAGEVAVVKHLGEVRDVRTAGTYFDFWVTERYERYDAKVQSMDISSQAYSSDGQTMDINMTVQYSIDQSKVKDIVIQYGNLNAVANKLEKVAIERAKATLSKQSAMKIIETRATVSPDVEAAVKEVVDSSYYVTIHTVVLTNIDFTDEFEKTVEQKMIAEQQKLQAEYEAEKKKIEAQAAADIAKIEAEAQVAVARSQAEAKFAAAEGDAKAQREIARAEAYSTQIKVVELARSLGYTVTTKYVQDEEGKNTTEVDSYEIEWGKDEAAETSKQALLTYLQYLEYLSKWDGKLPDVVTGDSGVMITIPSAPKGE